LGSWIIGLVIAFAIIVVVFLIAGLVYSRRQRKRLHQGDWANQALQACAEAEALRDRLAIELTPVRRAAGDGAPAGWWSDAEHSMEQLATRLHALQFNAPNYTTDQATQDLLMALAALRSTLQVEHGAKAISSAPAGEPVSTAEARLIEFEGATRALRDAI
jgi:hypothetical protein